MKLHPREKRRRLESFEQLCRERGIPVTVQRRAIYEAVLDCPDHPTADDVFDAVGMRLEGVSRVTVYRVLETLVRLGLIGKASHPGSATRYDVKTARHHHLVCVQCERTTDLDDPSLDRLKFPDTGLHGFEVADFSIHFTGLCRSCRERTGSRAAGRGRMRSRRSRA